MNKTVARLLQTPRRLMLNIGSLGVLFIAVAGLSSGFASHISNTRSTLDVPPADKLDINQPEMVLIPAGSVETPEPFPLVDTVDGEHSINIEKSFYMSKYEITFDQWDDCVDSGGCSYKPGDKSWGRGNRPVINISWRDIDQYLSWLSKSTGKEYRLPTELEWEYAARAGSSERFGPPPLFTDPKLAWASAYIMAPAPPLETQPVDVGEPNAFGLYGIRGNVWEWTDTCFRSNSTTTDESCGIRILRGEHRSIMPNFLREIGTGGCAIKPLPGNFGFRVVTTSDSETHS